MTSAAGQYRLLVGLTLRRHWPVLSAWLGGALLLVAITAPSYETAYPELSQRTFMVESLRANAATALLYGPLPDPGTLGQLLMWETGTYVLVLGALMGILLAVTLVRRPEDEGTLELVRSTGTAPWIPTAAALTVLVGQCLALGGGAGLILWLQAQRIGELTEDGALAFGLLVLAVSLMFALITVVCCQLAPDARTARSWALLVLAAAFVARAVPDATATLDESGRAPVTLLHWLSPLGWAQVVAPYSEDRFAAFGMIGAAAVVLLAAGLWLTTRREHRSGILAVRSGSSARLRVRSPLALALRRGIGSWVGWTVAVVGLAALVAGMSSGMLDLIEGSDATAQMVRQVLGEGSLTSVFFRMTALLSGILAGIYAVGTVLRARSDEREGLLDVELTTGRRRWEPLVAAGVTAAVGSLLMLVLAGLATAVVARGQLGDEASLDQTLGYPVLQWPAAVCLAGLTALAVAAVPRLSRLMWLTVAVCATLAWLGGLLDPPPWLMDLVVFEHVPDLAADDPAYGPLALLAGIGLAGLLAAVPLMRRRDVTRS